MRKILTCCIFLICYIKISYSQILITEVNFDVPVSEKLHVSQEAHYGEFIELYNYTDTDIDLSGWVLVDHVSNFHFPNGTTIKSNDFFVVGFKQFLDNNANPILEMYPATTQGHEDKIIYQSRLILRNDYERVRLITTKINGINLPRPYVISEFSYRTTDHIHGKYSDYPIYEIKNHNLDAVNFSEFPSLHFLAVSKIYSINSPSPFFIQEIPETENFLSTLIPILTEHYDIITWVDEVNDILNTECDKEVLAIYQESTLNLTEEKFCAFYDNSGNLIGWINCNEDDEEDDEEDDGDFEYTYDELQEISSKIYIAPNPTNHDINIMWDEEYIGVISSLSASSVYGNTFYNSDSLSSIGSTTVLLSYKPTGVYIITFQLNTGQFISKNVIKH